MDILPDENAGEASVSLSYDDNVPYDQQVSAEPAASESLVNRIGQTKVYLISDAAGTRTGKRKFEEEEGEEEGMEEDVSDPLLRDNAILFHGSPISSLPTSNLFAYATHFDAHPHALEWIDDTTCILVFPNKAAARGAFRYLAKSHAEEPSDEGFITSKPIPIALWPPEERINKSLGMSEGLKGAIRMRWALTSDIKKRGAKKESEFYKKYGLNAGRAGPGMEDSRPAKRSRGEEGEGNVVTQKAQLDAELDAFLAEDDSESLPPPSPPSKMRSDYIDVRGKTLLERTSDIRQHPITLESRLTEQPHRRERRERWGEEGGTSLSERIGGERSGRRRRSREPTGGRRHERPRATQAELDAELDAFLSSKDN